MTAREAAYLVTLDADLREDDAEATRTALRMVRGVIAVEPVESDPNLQIAQLRADAKWRRKISDFAARVQSDNFWGVE